MIKRYKILKPIMLSFSLARDTGRRGPKMSDRGWSFEWWFLWILLVFGAIFYQCYNAEACKKMRCPAGTKPRYFISTYNSSCVCEPTGWRQ